MLSYYLRIKPTICICHSGKSGQLESEKTSLQSELQSQKELIEQLELDVSSLQNLSTHHRGEAEVGCPGSQWYQLHAESLI